jgi:hypothetical protein
LIEGVGQRYRASSGKEKPKILEEFVRLTGYHRKHAIRVLNGNAAKRAERRPRERIYDEAVRQALIILWEAADRICSKRLKAAQPLLIAAMERHGHLALDAGVRQRLLAMSTATTDRPAPSPRVGKGSLVAGAGARSTPRYARAFRSAPLSTGRTSSRVSSR